MKQLTQRARISLAALLVLGTVGCDSGSQTQSPVTPASAQPVNQVSSPASDPDTYLASGPLVVENQIDVAAQREGIVAKILVDTGKSVRKGQLLAVLDDRQLRADREAAEAKLRALDADVKNWEAEVKVLQADLDRAEKMWAAQLITREQLDHARFKVEADQYEVERERQNAQNQQAVLRSLNLELEKTQIAAPFDGVVARRYVRAGQKVALGDRLFWVTAVAPLRVKFTLPERFVGKVRVGERVSISIAESHAPMHLAKVIQVSPVVDPSSDTIEVLAELEGRPADLRPGMTAQVQVGDSR
jgi:RND family efflux transporter MFP subunit